MQYLGSTFGGGYLAGPDDEVAIRGDSSRDLLWIEGQSNGEGYASAATLSAPNATYATTYPAVRLIEQYAVAQDPLAYRYYPGGGTTPPSTFGDTEPHFFPSVHADCIGPALSAARDLNAIRPNGWAIANFSISGSDLNSNWLPSAAYPASTQPPNLFTQSLTFLANAIALGNTLRCRAWIQGEHDATIQANALAYAANSETFHAAIEAAYPGTPLVVIQLHSGASPTYTSTVRAQQVLFRNAHAWTTLIDCSDLTLSDGLHYTADSYVTIGQRIVAAYVAAIATTTITATLADSADPDVTSSAYAYTLALNNTGAVTAANVAAVITLPAGCTYSNSSGTGWTTSASGQVVTCTRATMATGAAPTITVNVVAPSSLATNPITCTCTVVADNLATLVTDSEQTTLTAPAITQDSTRLVYLPSSDAEWTSLGVSGLSVPNWGWICDGIASGNLTDYNGIITLTPNGTNIANILYQQAITGWSKRGVNFQNGQSQSFRNAAGTTPNPATTSQLTCSYWQFASAPSTNRNFVEFFSSAIQSSRITLTPRIQSQFNGALVTGTVSPVGNNGMIVWTQYDRTNSSAGTYTQDEKLAATYSQRGGTALGFGGSIGALAPNGTLIAAWGWAGVRAEISLTVIKTTSQALGWIVPWSP